MKQLHWNVKDSLLCRPGDVREIWFDYIEIRFDCVKDYLKEHTLEELADWFKNHHLKPWAYNTLIFFNQRDEAWGKRD